MVNGELLMARRASQLTIVASAGQQNRQFLVELSVVRALAPIIKANEIGL
jgi:hypothetical protein